MSPELQGLVHAAIVAVLGVVVVMLRQQNTRTKAAIDVKADNGAGELYRRIEDAERRMQEKVEASRLEILSAVRDLARERP